MILAGLKWGENLERDCAELRRLESYGLYATGHHDSNCPLEFCPHRPKKNQPEPLSN